MDRALYAGLFFFLLSFFASILASEGALLFLCARHLFTAGKDGGELGDNEQVDMG